MTDIKHCFLALVAACTGVSAQAQSTSPVAIHGSAGIKDIKVELMDMRTGDGIAPSFVRQSPGGSEMEAYWGFDDGGTTSQQESSLVQARGSLLDPMEVDVALAHGEASLSKRGNGLFMDIDVRASSFERSVYSYQGSWPAGGGRFGATYETRGGSQWLLGAGTQVKLSGIAYIDLNVNTDPVVGLTKGHVLDVSASIDGRIGWRVPYGASTDVLGGQEYLDQSFSASVVQRVSPRGSGSSGGSNDVQAIPFELIARNNGTGAARLGFDAYLVGSGRWDLAQGPITSVPEPGAWGLGLAGLLTLGACARGRRRS